MYLTLLCVIGKIQTEIPKCKFQLITKTEYLPALHLRRGNIRFWESWGWDWG